MKNTPASKAGTAHAHPAVRAKARPNRRNTVSRREVVTTLKEIEALRTHLERTAKRGGPPRLNTDPEDVQRSVARLVLTLVEFIRRLLERQAIRRMEAGTLTPEQTEAIGTALMRLEETLVELARKFDLSPDELNLELGPLGRLM